MKKIIVTVQDKAGTFEYDMELPTDLTADKLTDDVVQTLNGCDPNIIFSADSTVLYSRRLGRSIGREETLAQAGVWNGDVLFIYSGRTA
jgi:uncharacterized ubiquitin-like protein YukD